jgi:NitT/TauT family transport system permease protein
MKKSAILNWIFSMSFVIQLLFSRDWMFHGEGTLWYALQPLLASVLVIFRPSVIKAMPGKIMISLLITSGCLATLNSVYAAEPGTLTWGIWLYAVTLIGLMWQLMGFWSGIDTRLNKKIAVAVNLLVPVLFGGMLLYLWEMITLGFEVPQVLLPSPSLIGIAFANSLEVLWADFQQTFMKAVLVGFFLGSGSGFIVAVLVDKVPFLQRGLLPLGNLASALPIVGVAPIMVMWFGFDWQSKAAVVMMMTFFPMLVNTLTGLKSTGRMELDLMHSYAANYWQMLFKVRLQNALPFIFNALKINSTLALIGAIVAEFFGTPIVGMGFRISTEIGRMNVDVVWASIAVAALSGSLFYALLALLERQFTGWHPSFRVG